MIDFLAPRPEAAFDEECFHNYFAVGFKSIADGRFRVFEQYPGCELDRQGIATVLRKWRIFGFNSTNYDIPLLMLAMRGATNEELKDFSDLLIKSTRRGKDSVFVPIWKIMERYELSIPSFVDHVDLQQVSPGSPQFPSLKLLGGRLHSHRMQEMPIHHDTPVYEAERQVIRPYHANDMDTTIDLKNDLKAQIDLRSLMSKEYKVDLRSKSDAQVAEAVLKAEIERLSGQKVQYANTDEQYFHYDCPAFIKFKSEKLNLILEGIKGTKFWVGLSGKVLMPDYIKGLRISIGSSVYKMGVGGLHSTEKRVSHYSNEDYVLLDRDFTSYYPLIILVLKLFPKHIGELFLKVYKSIFDRRVNAKKMKLKDIAETLKIVLNGSFGKFGSPYSKLYGPKLLIQTTITGQLCLLMLIEAVELAGFRVVSANTDGFVTLVERKRRHVYNDIIEQMEVNSGLKTEEAEYISLHSRDVNNYIALKWDDDEVGVVVKTKGDYGASGPGLPGAAGQKKNPDMAVSTEAAIGFLLNGASIEDHIDFEFDPRKFVTVRKVNTGAYKDGEYLGKAIRWYYSRDVQGSFTTEAGAQVSKTNGAKLMMTLPRHLPPDVDYDYYVREAYAILQEVGVRITDPALRDRYGLVYARLPKTKTLHLVNLKSGIALCGKDRASIRDAWEEHGTPTEKGAMWSASGLRVCSKCRKEEDDE